MVDRIFQQADTSRDGVIQLAELEAVLVNNWGMNCTSSAVFCFSFFEYEFSANMVFQ